MNRAHRILDANFNRSIEALRVVEDYCRFVNNNRDFSLSLKSIRHRFIETLLPYLDQWRASRDTTSDRTKFDDMRNDKNSIDVIKGNLSRIKESLRTIEEYLKIISVKKSGVIRSLRFKIYALEKDILSRRRGLIRDAGLYVILSTNVSSSVTGFMRIAQQVIEGKPDVVQLRDKKLADGERLRILMKLKKLCGDNVLLIVNDRPDLCLAAGADGVHIGNEDLPVRHCREILGNEKIIGKTVHNLREIITSGEEDTDYLAYGTFFESKTKRRETLKRAEWRHVTKSEKPVFAVGGIDNNKACMLKKRGLKRIAVCSEIMQAKNPSYAVRSFKRLLKA